MRPVGHKRTHEVLVQIDHMAHMLKVMWILTPPAANSETERGSHKEQQARLKINVTRDISILPGDQAVYVFGR